MAKRSSIQAEITERNRTKVIGSILICDDHPLVREAILATLQGRWPDAKIREAGNFPDAWDAAAAGFDLCLCDLGMPGATAREGILKFKAQAPDMPIVIVTGLQDDHLMLSLLNLGVNGFVDKNKGGQVLIAAIEIVAAGERYIPSSAYELWRKHNTQFETLITLTHQQRKVVSLVAMGKSNKLIANEMGVAASTIKSHLEQAMRATKTTSRFEVAHAARKAGLI